MRGGIPFRVIERKYTEGTNSRSHAYNTLSVLYIEGEAWQEPLQEKQGYTVNIPRLLCMLLIHPLQRVSYLLCPPLRLYGLQPGPSERTSFTDVGGTHG